MKEWMFRVWIEACWYYVLFLRRKGAHMLNRGEQTSSPRFLRLGRQITELGLMIFRWEDQFETEFLH